MDLAFAVATGRPWLCETFTVSAGKVLIIDNELHRETIAHRLRRMAEACSVPIDLIREQVDICSLRGQNRDLRRIGTGLQRVKPNTYRLVIVDAFYRAMPVDTDENSNGTMAQLYNQIDTIADHLQSGITLIHHASKGNQSEKSITDVGSGAGAQSRAVDTHLVLRPHEQDDVYVLDAAVRSFPPVAPLCLKWSFPLWTPIPDLDPTALRTRKKRKRSADTDVQTDPPWDAKRFANTFGKPEPQLRDAVLDDARLLIKSANKRKDLFKAAIAKGYLHEWKVKGAASKTVVSTLPQVECVCERPPITPPGCENAPGGQGFLPIHEQEDADAKAG